MNSQVSSGGGGTPSTKAAQAARGGLHPPHTATAPAGKQDELIRVLRVPMGKIEKEAYKELRSAARDAADFSNRLLAEWYCKAVMQVKPDKSAFKEYGDRLLGEIAVSLAVIAERLQRPVINLPVLGADTTEVRS